MSSDLLDAALPELLERARVIRDSAHGTRITYSPKVFVPLTTLCRDRCGYCTFAQPPARTVAPYLAPEAVLEIADRGARAGCHEVLFTLGERPEERYPVAREWLDGHGFSSTIEYLAEVCELVLRETGLLPHANAGALSADELSALRPVSPSQGMMIESLDDALACHAGSPDKTPQRRLATLEAAGRLRIPFTTGILVGIGESRASRLEALRAIADSHQRHGHVQEVIVQNFLPKPGTAMHEAAPCSLDEHLEAIAMARIVLPPEVSIQAPPNLSGDLAPLIEAGIDDWGGVSPVTVDHVNPERPWPAIDHLREVTEQGGFELAPRLTIHPRYVLEPEVWVDERLRSALLDRSDAEGLGRDDPGAVFPEPGTAERVSTAWCAGSPLPPPTLVPASAQVAGAVNEVLAGVLLGQEPGAEELVSLFAARGREVAAVAEVADELRREAAGDVVTFVRNRNINYTNICTFKCRFCAFSKGPLSLNLRGSPYLLTLGEIQQRVLEAEAAGATEVCLQGGIHPDFDGEYYVDVASAVHEAAPAMHIHGFTALEVTEGARRLGEPLREYLARLREAGLRTLPGTAAEILDDEVRAILCPDKIDTETWLEVHRTAHSVGLRSNVTIMFGAVESPASWAGHLICTRELQKETGGFTEFVPLPFVHMAAPIYLQGRARRGPTFREALLMHAVGRIAYRGSIPNVQASWVKMGMTGVLQLLQAGVNDLGGTLMDENISRAAGAEHGQLARSEDFRALVEPLGRTLEQRTTTYGRVVAA